MTVRTKPNTFFTEPKSLLRVDGDKDRYVVYDGDVTMTLAQIISLPELFEVTGTIHDWLESFHPNAPEIAEQYFRTEHEFLYGEEPPKHKRYLRDHITFAMSFKEAIEKSFGTSRVWSQGKDPHWFFFTYLPMCIERMREAIKLRNALKDAEVSILIGEVKIDELKTLKDMKEELGKEE